MPKTPKKLEPKSMLQVRKAIAKVPTRTVVPESAEYLAVRSRLATVGNGLEVRASSVPAAGMGLFATRNFAKGDPVTEYEGKLITHSEAKQLSKEDRSHVRSHILQRWAINGKIVGGRPISASSLQGRGGGAMVNHVASSKANVVFDHVDSAKFAAEMANWMSSPSSPFPDPHGRITFMRASKPIKKGDELFAYYGKDYWK